MWGDIPWMQRCACHTNLELINAGVHCSSLKLLSCVFLLRGKIELGFLSPREAWGNVHWCERTGDLPSLAVELGYGVFKPSGAGR